MTTFGATYHQPKELTPRHIAYCKDQSRDKHKVMKSYTGTTGRGAYMMNMSGGGGGGGGGGGIYYLEEFF